MTMGTEGAVTQVKEWAPSSIQNYNARYPQWAHRFADKNPQNRRGDRLAYWLQQGWEVAPYGNEGMKGNRSTGASSGDGAVHYRGLILIRAPWALVRARNEHYRDMHKRLMKANQAARELSAASASVNADTRRKLTSAFGSADVTKGHRVLEASRHDTAAPDPEKILRDTDPAALRELRDRLDEAEAEKRQLAQENEALRREREERAKRPSDRKRKHFPVS